MNTLFKSLLALVAISTLAKAHYLGRFDMTYDNYKRIELSECEGYATVTAQTYTLTLKVVGNNNCSRVVVNGQTFTSEVNYAGERSAVINIDLVSGYNTTSVEFTSKSGKTRDTLTLVKNKSQQAPVLTDEDWVYLPRCGGSAKFDVQNGQANLKLKGISTYTCDSITISANGESRTYNLNSSNSSFTVPRSMIDYGSNSVRVKLSSSGYPVETVILKFRAY